MVLTRAAALLLACLLVPGALPAGAAGLLRALAPDHGRLQTAGAQGLIAAGPGWAFVGDRVHAELLYGWAPAALAGRDVHALAQKTTVAPLVLRPRRGLALSPLLAGWSANVALGESYYLFLPERFQDYYWPSALRFWLFAGARGAAAVPGPGPVRGLAVVAEVGAPDAYWLAWLRNDFLRLEDILSLSLAVQVGFGR